MENHTLATVQAEFSTCSVKEIEDAYVAAKAIPAKKRSTRDCIIVSVGKELIKMRKEEDMGDMTIKVRSSVFLGDLRGVRVRCSDCASYLRVWSVPQLFSCSALCSVDCLGLDFGATSSGATSWGWRTCNARHGMRSMVISSASRWRIGYAWASSPTRPSC